jgi:hypothetical protein
MRFASNEPSIEDGLSSRADSGLKGLRTPKHSGRKHDEPAYHRKHALDGDAHDTEWNQKNPHDRVSDERQQRKGPAQHEQETPKHELHHIVRIRSPATFVPAFVPAFVRSCLLVDPSARARDTRSDAVVGQAADERARS